jgi:outer membrane protein TolC
VKNIFTGLFVIIMFPTAVLSAVNVRDPRPPAGQGMTLADVIAEVKAGNPSLTAARRQLVVLEAGVKINSAYPNPGIEIEKAASGGSDGYEIKAVQPVPLTRRAGTAAAAARADLEAAKKETEALENFTLSSARKVWYALRIAKERRNFEETNLKFSMDILNNIEMRMQTGEAGNADLARAKVEASRSGYHLQEAEMARNAAAGALNSLMGRRPDTPLSVAENGFSLAPVPPDLKPLEAYTGAALLNRVEPRALDLNVKAADLSAALEKGKRLPVPELGFIRGSDGGTGYSRLFLGFELPLWYDNKGEIKKALAHKDALVYGRSRLELAIRLEVYNTWLELGLAQKRLAASRETVFLLNDLRRTASQEYLSGKIDLAAFYETNRIFLEENVNYLDALKEYYEKNAQMDAVTNNGEEK